MIISYPAKIAYSKKDYSYLVEFPDLEGCLSEVSTMKETLSNAKEALTGYLSSLVARRAKIPKPSKRTGLNIYIIEPQQ